MKEILHGYAASTWHWIQTNGVDVSMRVLAASVILLVGLVAIRLLAKAMKASISHFAGSKKLAASFIVSVAVKSAWACLAIIVLGKLGVDVGPLIAGLGVTGFVLGFAFQESLGSLASGLMIAINIPFKVGDYVSVAGYEGTVLKLDMMAVILSTADNRMVTIPNKSAWGSPIVNYSALELRRVDFLVGIDYGADITKAREVALATLSSIPKVVGDPAPMAEVKSLDSSSVTISARCWVKNADYWEVFFRGNQMLKEAMDASGIEIPFNKLDVTVRNRS